MFLFQIGSFYENVEGMLFIIIKQASESIHSASQNAGLETREEILGKTKECTKTFNKFCWRNYIKRFFVEGLEATGSQFGNLLFPNETHFMILELSLIFIQFA